MENERWIAVLNRDQEMAGSFIYAVKTTGIYCRPGCSSRLPRRQNVEFFDTPVDARKAGYRSCQKCLPDTSPDAAGIKVVIDACRLISSSTPQPSLTELARNAMMSPGHFHRLFKKITGITAKEYASSLRSERFLEAIDKGKSVTEAVYEAGFSGPSRAYEGLKSRIGMTPTEYRNGARGLVISYTTTECFLGWTVVAATERGICAVLFGDRQSEMSDLVRERFPEAQLNEATRADSRLLNQAVAAIENPSGSSKLPLDIIGTAFQKQVWKALMNVGAGETCSYAEIAKKIGKPKASRAVAGACAANKIGLLVPCHRVVRTDGSLGGYRWGLERKRMILDRENQSDA